ncbi:hypothetical protein MNEG_6351, partial [Monoraphidium neglectum]
MAGHSLHREIVASAASLKSCLRGLALALGASVPTASTVDAGAKAAGAASRAVGAAASLKKLLGGASGEQELLLPLDTSKRLVEVNLPDSLQQLLAASDPSAARWPLPRCAEAGAEAGPARSAAPLEHPLWQQVQLVVADTCECLSLLARVALRACARSDDPLGVILQICGPQPAAAAARYLGALRALEEGNGGHGAPTTAAARAAACMTAALLSPLGAMGATAGPDTELRAQLAGSCREAGLLGAACGALMAAAKPLAAGGGVDEETERTVEAAAGHLLSLCLFMSGVDTDFSGADHEMVVAQPAAGEAVGPEPGSEDGSGDGGAHWRHEDAPRFAEHWEAPAGGASSWEQPPLQHQRQGGLSAALGACRPALAPLS